MSKEKVAILGASSGLGAALTRCFYLNGFSELLLISRKKDRLDALRDQAPNDLKSKVLVVSRDFSRPEDQMSTLINLEEFKPQKIICMAGGGPFGKFVEKDWKDHLWAWQVTFQFSARVLHFAEQKLIKHGCKQVVFIGSSIAENEGDPGAASYAAAKHALKGLYASYVKEQPKLDLRLYSPGYMNTGMLPASAWPRQQEGLVTEPGDVAQDLLLFMLKNETGTHRTYSSAYAPRQS